MKTEKIVLKESIYDKINKYFDGHVYYRESQVPKVVFKNLKKSDLHELTLVELKTIENFFTTYHKFLIDFIIQMDGYAEFNATFKDLAKVVHQVEDDWNPHFTDMLINKKFTENCLARSRNGVIKTIEESRLYESYSLFYNELTLNEIVYLHKDSYKLKLFDQILLEFFFPKLSNHECYFTSNDIITTISGCLKLLDGHDNSMPLLWFTELNSEEFENLFKLILIPNGNVRKL